MSNKRFSKRTLDENNVGIYFGGEFLGVINYDIYTQQYIGTHVVEGYSEPSNVIDDVYEWFKRFVR